MYKFEIEKQSKKSKARIGKIITPHGTIKTPAFIPVATLGVLKGGVLTQETEIQCQITNTFHFLDLNRVRQVEKAGGLHAFFNFDKPIFTDSGGFQIFSLGKGKELGLGKISSVFSQERTLIKKGKNLLKISQRGAKFRSPRDNREILLTPEFSCKTQEKLGADFIYLLDVCGTPVDSYNRTKKDLDITEQWYKRFLKTHKSKQKVFAIVQGGTYKDLREKSSLFVNNLDVFGLAIGGALGKNKKEMYKIISWVNKKIDFQRPHHLLGIGDTETMEQIIKLGIDLFDCALPTRIARHGTAMTSKGYLNLTSGRFKDDFTPIEKNCQCPVCQKWTKAQINFLFKAKEQIGGRLLTIHNLWFMEKSLEKIRKNIDQNKI